MVEIHVCMVTFMIAMKMLGSALNVTQAMLLLVPRRWSVLLNRPTAFGTITTFTKDRQHRQVASRLLELTFVMEELLYITLIKLLVHWGVLRPTSG